MSADAVITPTAWDHRKYGSREQPIHKSDYGKALGQFGCLKAFELNRRHEFQAATVPARRALGNAIHAVFARALSKPDVRESILHADGKVIFSLQSITKVLREELDKEADGREVTAKNGETVDGLIEERAVMASAVLHSLHTEVKEVLAVEAPFLAPIGKRYWLGGTIDMLAIDRRGRLVVYDWKSGKNLPTQWVLDMGPELSFYAHAVRYGVFGPWPSHDRNASEQALIADTEHEQPTYGQFPDRSCWVHMQNALPYKRASSKKVTRAEDARHFGVEVGDTVKTKAGDTRGALYYHANRTDWDRHKLEHTVNQFVRIVRMGAFPERITDDCNRCEVRRVCMNEGHHLRDDEAKQAKRTLAMLPANYDDGLGDIA